MATKKKTAEELKKELQAKGVKVATGGGGSTSVNTASANKKATSGSTTSTASTTAKKTAVSNTVTMPTVKQRPASSSTTTKKTTSVFPQNDTMPVVKDTPKKANTTTKKNNTSNDGAYFLPDKIKKVTPKNDTVALGDSALKKDYAKTVTESKQKWNPVDYLKTDEQWFAKQIASGNTKADATAAEKELEKNKARVTLASQSNPGQTTNDRLALLQEWYGILDKYNKGNGSGKSLAWDSRILTNAIQQASEWENEYNQMGDLGMAKTMQAAVRNLKYYKNLLQPSYNEYASGFVSQKQMEAALRNDFDTYAYEFGEHSSKEELDQQIRELRNEVEASTNETERQQLQQMLDYYELYRRTRYLSDDIAAIKDPEEQKRAIQTQVAQAQQNFYEAPAPIVNNYTEIVDLEAKHRDLASAYEYILDGDVTVEDAIYDINSKYPEYNFTSQADIYQEIRAIDRRIADLQHSTAGHQEMVDAYNEYPKALEEYEYNKNILFDLQHGVNDIEKQPDYAALTEGYETYFKDSLSKSAWADMGYIFNTLTEEQKKRAVYLAKTAGGEVAMEYIHDYAGIDTPALKPTADERGYQNLMGAAADWMDGNSSIANLALGAGSSFAAPFIEDVAGAASVVKDLFGVENDPYQGVNLFAKEARGYSSAVIDDITKRHGIVAGTITRGVYDRISSIAPFLVGGAVGDIAGLSAEAGKKIGSAIIGVSAFASTYDDLVNERGVNKADAFLAATMAGIYEGFFEEHSLDSVLKLGNDKTLKSWFKTFLLNELYSVATEGSEELFTEAANILTEEFLLGDKSRWNTYLQMYGHDKAVTKIAEDLGMSMLMGGIGGALSYPVSSFTRAAGNSIKIHNFQKQVRNFTKDQEAKSAKAIADLKNRALSNAGAETKLAAMQGRAQGLTVSDTGKTVLSSTGEDVKINKLTGVGDTATVEVKTGDGTTKEVNLADINYESDAQREAVAYAQDMENVDMANAFLATAGTSTDLNKTATRMSQVYRAASQNNLSREYFNNTILSEGLTPHQIDAAYNYAHAEYEAAAAERKTSTENRVKELLGSKNWAGGNVTYDTNVDPLNFTEDDQWISDLGYTLAGTFGVNVNLVRSTPDANGNFSSGTMNGAYNRGTNTITIDLNAGKKTTSDSLARQAILTTVAHELTHAIQQNSAAKYDELKSAVIGLMESSGADIDARIAHIMELDTSIGDDYTKAMDELVAQACENMLYDSDLFSKLEEAHPEAAKTFKGKVKEFVGKLADALRKVFGVQKSNSMMAQLVESSDKKSLIRQLWEEGAMSASEVAGRTNENATDIETETETETEEAPAETVAAEMTEEQTEAVRNDEAVDTTTEIQNSLQHDEDYIDKAIAMNERLGNVSPMTMQQAKKARATIRDFFRDPKNANKLMLPPDILGNTFFSDSVYGGSEENISVCIRSLAAQELMDLVSKDLGRPLTVADTLYISQEIAGMTDRPECYYCYVATDRRAYREYLGEYLKQRNAVIEKYKNGANKDALYEEFLNGRKDTKEMKNRFNMWTKAVDNGTELITGKDLASLKDLFGEIMELRAAKKTSSLRYRQLLDATKYAQSASWAKKMTNYAAYNGHILKWKQTRIDNLNKEYGLRMYSFSDYSPAFLLENMQMVTDASVRGLKMLGYTKEIDFAKVFAPTGMNINVSVFAYEQNGEIAEDGMMGAAWAEAQALREQYPNVGIVMVATNDNIKNWAMAQDWVDVVIPYHLVRTGKAVAEHFGYKNYTSVSGDKKTKNWVKGNPKSVSPVEHRNDLIEYVNKLQEYGLSPRFEEDLNGYEDYLNGTITESDFRAMNPYYMKLVNETRRSYADTNAVQPVFDMDSAMSSIQSMMDQGGYYTPIGRSVEAETEIAEELAGKIRENGDDVFYQVRGADMGININDDEQPFTDQILSGDKTIETRDSPSLHPYVDKRIGLVKTGKGKQAMLVGYATISEEKHYATLEEFRADESKHLVSEGSSFDFVNSKHGEKYGYVLTDVERIDPEPVKSRGNVSRKLNQDVRYQVRDQKTDGFEITPEEEAKFASLYTMDVVSIARAMSKMSGEELEKLSKWLDSYAPAETEDTASLWMEDELIEPEEPSTGENKRKLGKMSGGAKRFRDVILNRTFANDYDRKYDGNAVLKSKTIDDFIRSFNGEHIAYISTNDFLRLTTSSNRSLYAIKAGTEAWGNTNYINAAADRRANYNGAFYLRVDEDGNVVGHEGRHRTVALQSAGVEQIPVVIEGLRGKNVTSLRLNGQFEPTRHATITTIEKLTKDNRSAIESVFGNGTDNSFRFQIRDTETPSNRELLANALDTVAKTGDEKAWLSGYRKQLDDLNKVQDQLNTANATIRELAFKKGRTAEESEQLANAKALAKELRENLANKDKALLKLEAAEPLQNVLRVTQDTLKAEEAGKIADLRKTFNDKFATEIERQREMRKGAVDRLRNSAERQKLRKRIIREVKNLDTALRTPSDKKHLPDELRGAVLAMMEPFTNDTSVFSRDKLASVKLAYEAMKSQETDASHFYDEDIGEMLGQLSGLLDGKRLSKLTEEELNTVKKIVGHFTMLAKNANTMFYDGRRVRIDDLATQAETEITSKELKARRKGQLPAMYRQLKEGNITVPYFFKRLGGTMGDLGNKILQGESVLGLLGEEYKGKLTEIEKKYNHKAWANDKATLTLNTENGESIELNREEALALYATYRRESSNKLQNAKHLEKGGIIKQKDAKAMIGKKAAENANGTKITDADMAKVMSWLTQEQMNYADAMVKLVSSDLSALGNEVSKRLYGWSKFGEGYYYPYKTSSDMRKTNLSSSEDAPVLLRSMSFTKGTVQHASTPIVLSGFTDTVGSHVAEMLTFVSLAEAQDNFMRVFDHKLTDSATVKSMMKTYYGTEVNGYITQFMRDLHGGVTADVSDRAVDKLVSRFKRGAVLANASVAIQQASSIGRAFALVNPKYFANIPKLGSWKECMKYCGTAVVKDIGRFDTNMGQTMGSWLVDDGSSTTAMDRVDNVLGILPEKADQITWGAIWEAVKKEQAERTGLSRSSEELKQIAGKRFDEVMRFTQVYDSVMAKTQLMRSKSTMSKMITSFMAEPMVTYNMMVDAWADAREKNFKGFGKSLGGIAVNLILNSALAALVGGMRDKDDDESYTEKYVQSFFGNMADGMNPLTYIPIVKDAYSIFQGYDVERADMTVISDLKNYIDKITDENSDFATKMQYAAYALGNLTGMPVKNIWRDIESVWNTFNVVKDGNKNRPDWVKYAAMDAIRDSWALTGKLIGNDDKATNVENLLDALINGDADQEAAVREHMANYVKVSKRPITEKEIQSALKKAVQDRYLVGEITRADAGRLLVEECGVAKKSVNSMLDELDYQIEENGKLSEVGDNFIAGTMTRADATKALMTYKDMDEESAEKQIKKWQFEIDYDGLQYSELQEAYNNKQFTEDQIAKIMVKYGGMDEDKAKIQAAKWTLERGKGYQQTATGDYNLVDSIEYADIQDQFLAGKLTEQKARDALEAVGEKDADAIDRSIKAWTFEKDNHFKYDNLKDEYLAGRITLDQAAQYRADYTDKKKSDVLKDISGEWEYDKDHAEKKLTWEEFEDNYKAGTITKSEAQKDLIKYSGLSKADAYWRTEEWDYEASGKEWHGVGTKLEAAMASRNTAAIRAAMQERLDHNDWKDPKNPSNLVKAITDYWKPLYKAATESQRAQMESIICDCYEMAYTMCGEKYYGDSSKIKSIRKWLKD